LHALALGPRKPLETGRKPLGSERTCAASSGSRTRYGHDGHQVWARLVEWGPTADVGDPETAFPRDGWTGEKLPDTPEPVLYRI
jgi:hypothetical protein